MPGSNVRKHKRESIRASVMKILDVSRPLKTSEKVVLLALEDANEEIGPQRLRRELDYLEQKDLIRIPDRDAPTWMVGLTFKGVDVLDGAIERPPGIAKINFD